MTGNARRVVFDATPIQPQMKGLGFFLSSLLDELEKHQSTLFDRVYVDEAYAQEAKGRWPNLPILSVKSGPAILWEQWRLPRLIGKNKDTVLFTARDRVAPSLAGRTVMYLFEIPDYRFKASLRHGAGLYSQLSGKYNLWNFRYVVPKLQGLIVGSQATLKDVVEKYKIAPDIPQVIYASIPDQFKKEVPDQLREEARRVLTGGKPYVLHFSTGDPRDNSGVALQAFASACDRIPKDISLLIAGCDAETKIHLQIVGEALGIKERMIMAPFLSGDLLIAAYRGASAYLDPTLYEGFGMQLIEAMACGVPVLSSNVTSVPEVVRDSGLLYDSCDVDGFAEGLRRILNDSQLRNELIARGYQQASSFNYSETTKQIISFLGLESINI